MAVAVESNPGYAPQPASPAALRLSRHLVAADRRLPDELKAAYRELQAAKIGRKARLEGKVERIVPPSDEPTLEQKMAAAIAHAEPASPPSPAVTHIDKPTEEDIPDARATLERIRREHAAQREQEQRVRAQRGRREAARKPVFDDD
jgi:hypothetical protein